MRSHGNAREKLVTARAVVIIGQGGSGKSSMVQEVQNQIRQAGFYGVAKFEGESSIRSARETLPRPTIKSS
jgi:ABC-type phosphate/phosphonate transport system ATPase subunit